MNVNEQKMKLVGVLTWIIIAIPSVMYETHYRSLPGPRTAMLFGAFVIFIVAFIAGTRPNCTNATRISMIVVETLAAYACISFQATGFQPVLLVIIAAQIGAYPPRFAISAIAVNSIVLALIVSTTEGSPAIYALVYFAFSLFALFLVFFTTNSICVSGALGIVGNRSPWQIWKENTVSALPPSRRSVGYSGCSACPGR